MIKVTKTVFVDRREFSGPVYEQIEQAYQFVLRNIRLGATFNGLYRQDVYEIPTDAIRELIINAVVHRSYLDRGNIQVAIYDDRLEVTSPGKLPIGQTVERMKEGYSKIRNEALANAFSYMNLIEHWGSGIPRIVERVKEAGLREPEFIDGDIDLRINIYRAQLEKGDPDNGPNDPKMTEGDPNNDPDDPKMTEGDPNNDPNDPENTGGDSDNDPNSANTAAGNCDDEPLDVKLLRVIADSPEMTQKAISEKLGVSKVTIKRAMVKMQRAGTIRREGSNRSGKWIIE